MQRGSETIMFENDWIRNREREDRKFTLSGFVEWGSVGMILCPHGWPWTW